jgi:DNA mismatch repair protein MutL
MFAEPQVEAEVASLGFELRASGERSVAVHAVPSLLRRARPEELVRDLSAELTRTAARPFGNRVDLVLATMACHASVRAGDVLEPDEVRALLVGLDEVDFSGHCPHGRPVVTRLSFDELERRVGR